MDYEKELISEMSKAIDRIDRSVDGINITLAKQEIHLEEHIKRSKLLEDQMEPIKQHVNRVNSLLLLLGGIFALIGAIKGIIEIARVLHII